MGTLILKLSKLITVSALLAGCATDGNNMLENLKPLTPAIESNMAKLTDDTRESFKQSLTATQIADDAELRARTSPNDMTARGKLIEAARAEANAWNNYARHRTQLTQAVNTAKQQRYNVKKYFDQAAEMVNMERPIYDKVANRRI